MINITDRLIADARGDAERAIAYAERHGGKRLGDVVQYVHFIYAHAQDVGLDPAIVVAQAFHETGNFTSKWFVERLNVAGIGITGDPKQDAASGRWATGEDAAKGHLAHISAYVGVAVHDWLPYDPRYPAMVAAGYFGVAERIDDLTARWAVDRDYAAKIAAKGNALFPEIQNQEEPMALNMTRGLIPLPHEIMDIIDVSKRDQSSACRGYDWLGSRPDLPAFLVLHRPQSPANASIANYFHQRCCPALTDLECSSITGQFRRFVARGDAPSGWANGRVSAPYGDALKYLDHTGWDLDLVNRMGEAVEVSGWFAQPGTNVTREDPISEACWRALAQWAASRGHDSGIPWHEWPLIPSENNRSYITWHQEWTIGTGKICPGRVLMDGTAALIERARAIMRAAQTGGVEPPRPEPPRYASLLVPAFLTPRWINGGEDAAFDNGVKVFSLRRRWQARVDTRRLQHAGEGAPDVGPVLPAGRSTIGIGVYHSHGRWIVLGEFGERFEMRDMTDFAIFGYPTEEAA